MGVSDAAAAVFHVSERIMSTHLIQRVAAGGYPAEGTEGPRTGKLGPTSEVPAPLTP